MGGVVWRVASRLPVAVRVEKRVAARFEASGRSMARWFTAPAFIPGKASITLDNGATYPLMTHPTFTGGNLSSAPSGVLRTAVAARQDLGRLNGQSLRERRPLDFAAEEWQRFLRFG